MPPLSAGWGGGMLILDSQWVAWFSVSTQYHLQKHAPLVFDALRKIFTPSSVSFPDFGDDVLLADGRRVKSRLSSLYRQSHDTMSFPQRYEAPDNMSGGVPCGYFVALYVLDLQQYSRAIAWHCHCPGSSSWPNKRPWQGSLKDGVGN